MRLNSLQLVNFRNYNNLYLEFNKKVNLLLGKNGQGKTNIVESIYMLSFGKSFRTSRDKEIIKFDTENLNNTSFNFYKSKKPKLDELLDMFPKELAVYLKGKTTISKIPVTWECVGDDFEKSESYYFQFSPKWDKKYVLDKSLNKLKDAPYITARVLPDSNLKKRSVSGNSNETTIYNYLINNIDV